MRTPRLPSRLATLRLLAAIAIGGGAYSVYLMACQLFTGVGDKFAITSVPPSQLNGTYNIPYSVQFTTVHGTSPYTWKVIPNQGSSTVSPMPPGLTLDPNGATAGLLHGVPGAGSVGMYDFTIQATDNNNTVAMYAVCLTIYFQITPNPLTPATALSPYSVQLSGQGGTGPYGSWSTVASSPPPSWLSVSATGQLSGTPPAMGTATFSLQGKDANGNPGLQAETLTIGPALMITTASLPNGTVGAAYANGTGVTLAATGGVPPYTWSYTGSLPSNLSLNPNTGLLSGTPNTSGPVSITVIVTDHAMNTASQPFNFNIAPTGSAPTIAPAGPALPPGTAGTNYDGTGLQFTASGGSGSGYTWALGTGSGALPPTLALGPTTGLLSGPLTTAGPYSFSVKVTDGASNTTTQPYTIAVAIGITPSPLPQATVGVMYSQPLTATGGTGTLTWSTSGNLPSSITLNPSSGLLSGTPTNADLAGSPYSFAAKVSDAHGNMGLQEYLLTVALAPVTIMTASLNAATVGASFSQQLAATGGNGTYTWSVPAMNLPAAFSLSSGGLLTGNPTTTSGSPFMFTVEAMSGMATPGTMPYTLTVNPGPLVIATASPLPAGTVGQSYTTPLVATGGTGTYAWTASGGVPTGLTLNSDGTWSGTPTVANTFTFTATVTSGASNAQKPFMVTINPASTVAITTTSPLLVATAGTTYGMQFTASGGTAPYTWMETSPVAWPPGLSLSSSGLVSGVPSSAQPAATIPITVTDHNGNSTSGSFQLTVQAPSTSCTVLPNTVYLTATVGTTFNQTVYAEPASLCNASDLGYSAWQVADGSLPPGWTLTVNAEPGGTTGTTVTMISSNGPVSASISGNFYSFNLNWQGQDTSMPPQGHNATASFVISIVP